MIINKMGHFSLRVGMLFLPLCLLLLSPVFSQLSPQRLAEERAKSMRLPKIGKISGIVADDEAIALEFVTVALWKKIDETEILVTGTVTNEDGEFVIDGIPVGDYHAKFSFIGYQEVVKSSIKISEKFPEIFLGTTRLTPMSLELETVVVDGERDLYESTIDKKIYNVDKSIIGYGGAATDALVMIPSVQVGMEGEISLRGDQGVTILIDGKPTGMSGSSISSLLDQIPASSIKKIEVVTNPSAKYDAAGTAGIINIVLKKNQDNGFNGSVTLSAGTRHKYTGSGNLNYRKDKFNAYTNYSVYSKKRFFNGTTIRRTGTESVNILDQRDDGGKESDAFMIKSGFDYDISLRNTFSISGVFSNLGENRDQNIHYLGTDELGSTFFENNRVNNTMDDRKFMSLNADYKHTFLKPGQYFSSSINFMNGLHDGLIDHNQNFTIPEDIAVQIQRSTTNLDVSLFVFQNDFTYPVIEGVAKLDVGHKTTITQEDNNFQFENYDAASDSWSIDGNVSNQYHFRQDVHALYATYHSAIGLLEFQAGVRAEQTITKFDQKSISESFDNEYLNFFPSFFLLYPLSSTQEVKLNYSRRINRPQTSTLNPFVDFSDPLNLRTGNPNLEAEFTDSFEFSYSKDWKKFFFAPTLFFRKSTNVIQRVIEVSDDNISTVTFDNINQRYLTGGEFVLRYSPTSHWNLTLNSNVFNLRITGESEEYTNNGWTSDFMLMSNLRIPNVCQFQVMGQYISPITIPQGELDEIYSINIGIRRPVLKNQGNISLSITDISDSRAFNISTFGENFTHKSTKKNESRIATLTFVYKFGNLKNKNRNAGGDQQPDNKENLGKGDYF